MNDFVSGKTIWTGGYRVGKNKEDFAWIDSNMISDGNDVGIWNLFHTEEPNNADGKEYCIEQYDMKLNDVPCHLKRPFVCQKNPKV